MAKKIGDRGEIGPRIDANTGSLPIFFSLVASSRGVKLLASMNDEFEGMNLPMDAAPRYTGTVPANRPSNTCMQEKRRRGAVGKGRYDRE